MFPRSLYLPISTWRVVDNYSLLVVVDLGSAAGHTTSGRRPHGSIDDNLHRTSGLYIRSHVSLRLNSAVINNGQHRLWLFRWASAAGTIGTRSVRVTSLQLLSTGSLDVGVSTLLKTTIVAHRGFVAFNHLLRSHDLVSTQDTHDIGINLLGGSKSPAGTAIALVSVPPCSWSAWCNQTCPWTHAHSPCWKFCDTVLSRHQRQKQPLRKQLLLLVWFCV